MTGAELIVEFLKRKNVTNAYGYPGGFVLFLYDAIYRMGFPHTLARHEQGAAHAADGYARVTGKPGVVIATSGPGATNLVTGIANAHLDSVPMLAITGAVARKDTGTDAFQEADITGITLPITKYNYLVMNPLELLPMLEEAWELTTSGRPGPVLVNIPKDIQQMEIGDYDDLMANNRVRSTYVRHRPSKIRTESMAEKVYAALQASERPLLLAGGGCIISPGAVETLRAFVNHTGIPVANTLMGKGAISEDNPCYLGNVGMHGTPQANLAMGRSDLLLAVGARFSDRVIGDPARYNQLQDKKLIHVDIDIAEIGKNVRPDIEIEDDAADFFKKMLESPAAKGFAKDWQDWKEQLADKKSQYEMLKQQMYQPVARP
ncbi:MAG: thiamine pyrophosphate-binding protein [Saccharofermentanales bacterium]